MLDLDTISGNALEIFRSLFLGSDAKLVLLNSISGGFYNKLADAKIEFFQYRDPNGDINRLFVLERSLILTSEADTKPAVMENASFVGLHLAKDGLSLNEYVVYQVFNRKAPSLDAMRMWQCDLTYIGEIYRDNAS